MERIKKALERAREQRTEQPGGPLKSRRAEAVPQSEPAQTERKIAEVAPTQTETSVPSAPPSPTLVTETVQPVAQESARKIDAAVEKGQPLEKQPKKSTPDPKSRVPRDIEYSQTRRVEVSTKLLESNRVIAGIKDHPQSDLFRVLRTKILHRMRVDKINSLAITSPTKGAGKSLVSANLAVSLAMEANQTVMLVDLDLRKPSISKYFGFDAQQGVSDYLLEGIELPELLIHPGIDRLVILPAGNPVPQSSELLSTPRMAHLVEDITNRYATRIIVFDLPPLLHLDDALIFLPQVKSSLLVLEEGVNTPPEIEQSLMLLEKSNLLGTVYNKARQTKHLPY